LDVSDSDSPNDNSILVVLSSGGSSTGNAFVDRIVSGMPSSAPTPSASLAPGATGVPVSSVVPTAPPSVNVVPSLSGAPNQSLLGSISGNVKEDVDNNNSGDTNMSSVLISLLDNSGFVIRTTLTDTSGNYLFSSLPSGNYTVVELNPPGFVDVSDVDGLNDNRIFVVLGSGMNSTGNDFVDERLVGSSSAISCQK